MEKSTDFLQWLIPDLSSNILSYLDDPADLVRVSAVSRSWRQSVIANGFCKKLCLRLYPEVSNAISAIEDNNMIELVDFGSSNSTEDENLRRNHRVYAFLARGLYPVMRKDCILGAISASSTDNYPEETILNTLEPSDRVEQKASYWSSTGENDCAVPETLTYELISKLCFITEINIQPFQAFFQYGFPIYSSKAVRFRMGHVKAPLGISSDHVDEFVAGERSIDEYIAWTYVSPDFPMAQDNCLQKFKLPQPVLCIGGILQIELLGRVQQQEMDEKFYICVSHVQVVGRPLSPSFGADSVHRSGRCVVAYCPASTDKSSTSETASSEDETSGRAAPSRAAPSRLHSLTARLMQRAGMGFERTFLSMLFGNAVVDDGNTPVNYDHEMESESESDEALEA